jgi:hypothetical protein
MLASASVTGSRVINTSINYFTKNILSFTSLFQRSESTARPMTVTDRTGVVLMVGTSRVYRVKETRRKGN